jgi:hypothetical protein
MIVNIFECALLLFFKKRNTIYSQSRGLEHSISKSKYLPSLEVSQSTNSKCLPNLDVSRPRKSSLLAYLPSPKTDQTARRTLDEIIREMSTKVLFFF